MEEIQEVQGEHEDGDEFTIDFTPRIIVHENDLDILQNPYYGIEVENDGDEENQISRLSSFEKITIVNNLYYE